MSDYPTTGSAGPLFDPPAPTVTADDRERFDNQKDHILTLLKIKPRTTSELAGVCCNYRARLSELRGDGHTIKCHRFAGGNNRYELEGEA